MYFLPIELLSVFLLSCFLLRLILFHSSVPATLMINITTSKISIATAIIASMNGAIPVGSWLSSRAVLGEGLSSTV